jgi:hypothetical protein
MKTILTAIFAFAFAASAWAALPQQVTGGGDASSSSTQFIWTMGGTMTLGGSTPASTAQLQMIDSNDNDTVCNMTNIVYNKTAKLVTLTPSSCYFSSRTQNPPLELPISGDTMTFNVSYNAPENNYVLTSATISVRTNGEGTVNAVSGSAQVY